MTVFAASLAAIALLVGLAWLLGFRTTPCLADEAEARVLADAALYGFAADMVRLDDDRRGATLEGNGRRVRIDALGDRWVVHEA